MPGQFIPDDTEALREWARSLSSIANLAKARVSDIGNIASTVGQAGEGTAVNAIRSSLKKLQDRLTTASDHLSRGANALTSLANTLDRLEEEAERKFRSYGSPARFTPKWLEYETFGDPWAETNSAHHARSAAAKILQQLADEAPGAQHHEAAWQRFLGHIRNEAVDVGKGVIQGEKDLYNFDKDVVTGLAGEAVGIVETAWNLTKLSYDLSLTNLIVNHKGWAASWKNFIQTGEYVATHKKQVAGALWDGLIDKDMWHKDKAAWLVLLAINLVGPKGIGKIAGAAKGVEAGGEATANLSRTAEIPRGLSPSTTAFRRSVADRTLGSFEKIPGDARVGGHTFDRHVLPPGQSAWEYMKNRLDTHKWRPAEGVFNSDQAANRVMQEGFRVGESKIVSWLDDPNKVEPLEVRFKTTEDVGWAMARGPNKTYLMHPSQDVLMTLIKDPSDPSGFYVLRMYPEY